MQVIDVIEKLTQASGPTAKIRILKRYESPALRHALYYAYDPFVKYNIAKLPWRGKGHVSYEDAIPELDTLLSSLASGHGDDRLKRLTQVCIESLRPRDGELLKNVIKKDLRAGVSAKTINKAFPGFITEFGVMLAKQYESKRWDPRLMGSVKLDGIRCQVIDGGLYTRNGIRIVGAPHIEDQLSEFSNLDGELLIPGEDFQTSSGRIRSSDPIPTAQIFLFDEVDTERPFIFRYESLLQKAKERDWSTVLTKPTTVNVLKHRTFVSEAEMLDVFGKVLLKGYEGLVLKTPDHVYQYKRSADWLKVKNVLSEDLPAVMMFEGEGKYTGMLGGLMVQRKNGKLCAVGSGFSDEQRRLFWREPSTIIGKTVEVRYHEETPDGDLRHARFKGIRVDK